MKTPVQMRVGAHNVRHDVQGEFFPQLFAGGLKAATLTGPGR